MEDHKVPEEEYRKEPRSGTILKMLCPFYSAGAIIGDGGKEIKGIKESTGIAIQVSKKESRFPGTDERVVSLQGECDVLKTVVKFVHTKIREDKPPPNAKSIDVAGNEKRKGCLKLVVTNNMTGKIIGKGGETIKDLKERYKVEINTNKKYEAPGDLNERIVSVEGPDEEIEGCVNEIIDMVCEDKRSTMRWFIDYKEVEYGYNGGYHGGYHDHGYHGNGGYGNGGYDNYHGGRGGGGGGGYDGGRGYNGGYDQGYGGEYQDGYQGYNGGGGGRYGGGGYRR